MNVPASSSGNPFSIPAKGPDEVFLNYAQAETGINCEKPETQAGAHISKVRGFDAKPLGVSGRKMFTSRIGASIVMLFCFCVVSAAAGGNVPSSEYAPISVESAAPLRFRIVVDAPHPYNRLLEHRLPIVPWQASESVTTLLLERLAAEAKITSQEALAAEGYFSARVISRIERKNDGAVVRLNVELGPRTHKMTLLAWTHCD